MEKDIHSSVMYLMSGPAYLPYLVVSLRTLRDFWFGKVVVFSWPESWDILNNYIARDRRLSVEPILIKPKYRGKNAQFIHKIEIALEGEFFSPKELVLYLDADTAVNGSLDYLFFLAKNGFVATQFCKWNTNTPIIRKRIADLYKSEVIPKDLIEEVLSNEYPSLNGGVWGFCNCEAGKEVLATWRDWTLSVKNLFIADEKVLHLLPAHFGYRKGNESKVQVAEGGAYNCSTLNSIKNANGGVENPVIYHFHGNSNVRKEKSPYGYSLWTNIYRYCLEQNYGGLREWVSRSGNKYLLEIC